MQESLNLLREDLIRLKKKLVLQEVPSESAPPFLEKEPVPPGWNQGEFPGGLNAYRQTLPVESSHQGYQRALQLLDQGKIVQARALLEKITEKNADYPRALYWLGMIAMFQNQDYETASSFFSKSYQYCEHKKAYARFSVSVLLKLAESLFYQNKNTASRVVLEQCQQKAQEIGVIKEVQKDIAALIARLPQKEIK